MPPRVPVGKYGNWLTANPAQEWLWRCWEDATGCRVRPNGTIYRNANMGFISKVVGSDPWDLVVLGDAIEGRHHGSVELTSEDINEHGSMAADILRPLAEDAAGVDIVRGTECHARTIESDLGKALGARRNKTTGDYCHENLLAKINRVPTHFQHHIGTSTRPWSKSSALGQALVAEQANAIGFGSEPPRVIVRAHRHEYGRWENQQGLAVVLPPWQLLTRFARKVTQQHLAVPGIVILDYRRLDTEGLPTVHRKLYRPES